ncbi:hypothetical protein CEXT_130111 [Caerostris extrusa]|uniref:Uncharacterized protein n=1 Tax=Caerostris extrusa TaxID=172846 RepID=A0AAV4PLV2_CAEEX|nr:hypothetical protein CEXT_130111 [Caerostris extrusa]
MPNFHDYPNTFNNWKQLQQQYATSDTSWNQMYSLSNQQQNYDDESRSTILCISTTTAIVDSALPRRLNEKHSLLLLTQQNFQSTDFRAQPQHKGPQVHLDAARHPASPAPTQLEDLSCREAQLCLGAQCSYSNRLSPIRIHGVHILSALERNFLAYSGQSILTQSYSRVTLWLPLTSIHHTKREGKKVFPFGKSLFIILLSILRAISLGLVAEEKSELVLLLFLPESLERLRL